MEPKKQPSGTKSLVAPSVMEMVKNNPDAEIPERYIHTDLEPSFIPENGNHSEQIPVLSLDALLHGDLAELAKLHDACANWGFFQLVSHGVNTDVLERFKVESKELFEIPIEEKMKLSEKTEGFMYKFLVSEEKQQLDWTDSFFLTILPMHLRNPQFLSLLPTSFRASVESYSTEVKQVATKIFDCMAKDLKVDKEELRGLFDDGRASLRMGYYPPCPQHHKVIGSRPHSDASALTILIQLNQVDGLEIKKDGRWLRVKPLPNAFIINIGDIMEMVSNGIYKSVEHRVMVDPKMERMSVAAFFHAGLETEVGPIEGLVTPATPAKFRKITTSGYLKSFFARQSNGKLHIDTMRIDV